jgi:hypothetical protein
MCRARWIVHEGRSAAQRGSTIRARHIEAIEEQYKVSILMRVPFDREVWIGVAHRQLKPNNFSTNLTQAIEVAVREDESAGTYTGGWQRWSKSE